MVYIESGCSSTDYDSSGFVPGNIVLALYTSDCRTSDRSELAVQMGAGGLLIYSEDDGLFSSSAKNPMSIPIFAVSHEVGTTLFHTKEIGNNVKLTLYSETKQISSTTMNVLVDTPDGDGTKVVVSGSHLDSVTDGPGINDNGSGSASNLEIALQYARNNVKPVNKVRFAWWAAEELGLKGSTYYVENLAANDPQGLQNIALNVNYDMLGSPNFFRGIYNGSEAADNIRPGCVAIMKLYQDFFNDHSLSWELSPFTGRSDYGPFLEVSKIYF